MSRHNGMDDDEVRLFYAMTWIDNAECVKQLLASGMSPDFRFKGAGQTDKTAMHMAAECGQYECAKMLMNANANLALQDRWLMTPLMSSVTTGRVEMTNLLLTSPSCNVNQQCHNGQCALHFAVEISDPEVILALLKGGANPNVTDDVTRTPLWCAANKQGNMQIIEILVEHGAHVDWADSGECRTPLQVAIMRGRDDADKYVDYLMSKGADINRKDKFCCTSLMNVIRRNEHNKLKVLEEDLRLARKMIDAGCSLDAVFRGKLEFWHMWPGTALHMAAHRGAQPFVELLLKSGADPDIADNLSLTPLHAAAQKGHLAVAQLLVSANCDRTILGESIPDLEYVYDTHYSAPEWLTAGKILVTALHMSIMEEHWSIARLIITTGYDCRHETYLKTGINVPQQILDNPSFMDWLFEWRSAPLPLVEVCRRHILKTLRKPVLHSIDSMNLPPGVKRTLLYGNVS